MSDLIDRQELKYYVSSLSTHPLNEWDTWGVLAAIDKQPTVAASQWHRVEERLPDDSRDVIIFTASRITGVGSFIRPNWYQWYSGGGLPVDVTHWMPIEPPKEDA